MSGWRLQISLRSLLILTTATAIVIGWWFQIRNRVHDREVAIQKLTSRGFTFNYDRRRIPLWLANLIGDDLPGEPESAQLADSRKKLTNRDFALLAYFPQLHRLEVSCADLPKDLQIPVRNLRTLILGTIPYYGGQFPEEALRCLQDLPELESLSITGHQHKGDGLRYLASCPKLRHLELHMAIKNDPLVHLQVLPLLEHLDLTGTNVDDQGLLLDVAKLTNLRELNLTSLNVTNDGIADLKPLVKLKVLKLNYCSRISDDVVLHLQEFPRLQHIGLGMQTTDAVIPELCKMQALRIVSAPNSPLAKSPTAFANLKQALPQLKIVP
jgi:hypothetical protein